MCAPLGARLSDLPLGSRLVSNHRSKTHVGKCNFISQPPSLWMKENKADKVKTTHTVLSFKLCLLGFPYQFLSWGFLLERFKVTLIPKKEHQGQVARFCLSCLIKIWLPSVELGHWMVRLLSLQLRSLLGGFCSLSSWSTVMVSNCHHSSSCDCWIPIWTLDWASHTNPLSILAFSSHHTPTHHIYL